MTESCDALKVEIPKTRCEMQQSKRRNSAWRSRKSETLAKSLSVLLVLSRPLSTTSTRRLKSTAVVTLLRSRRTTMSSVPASPAISQSSRSSSRPKSSIAQNFLTSRPNLTTSSSRRSSLSWRPSVRWRSSSWLSTRPCG